MRPTLILLYRIAALLMLIGPAALLVWSLSIHSLKAEEVSLWMRISPWVVIFGMGWVSAWFWWRQSLLLKNRSVTWLPQLVRAFGSWIGGCIAAGGFLLFVLFNLFFGSVRIDLPLLFAPAVGLAIRYVSQWGADRLLKKKAGRP